MNNSSVNKLHRPAGICHNLSLDQRRADFEAEITRYAISKKIEAMSLEALRDLTDKQRLIAMQNGKLIAIIKACHANPKLDAYFAVLEIVYVMSDLRQRHCRLSAAQIGKVLIRSEGAIRKVLARLVDDGYIVKDDPICRGGVVPHFPALDKTLSHMTGSPVWVINGFVPGTFSRDASKKSPYRTGR